MNAEELARANEIAHQLEKTTKLLKFWQCVESPGDLEFQSEMPFSSLREIELEHMVPKVKALIVGALDGRARKLKADLEEI